MKKILVFSNGEKIGDGIIKLPLIKEIYKNYQDYEITWLANGNTVYTSILNNLSSKYLSKIISNAKLNILPWKKISRKYSFENEYYDVILDTQKTVMKTLSLKRIPSKIFISASASYFFSDIKLKNNNEKKYYVENLYELAGLPINKKLKYKHYFSFDGYLIKLLNNIFKYKKKCIGIAPGSGEEEKKWHIDNFIKVSKYFESLGYNIVFFVGPDDKFEKQKILKNFSNPFFPEDLINDFSGPEIVMASTNYLKCSLSNDSGVSHMLSTNISPLIKLFFDKDPKKFTPPNTNIFTISATEFGTGKINNIPTEYVINQMKKLLIN